MTPVAHTGIALLGWQLSAQEKNIKTLSFFVVLASLPDIDFLFFPHQSYTHNIFFVTLTALVLFPLFKRKRTRIGLLLVSLSHLVLDLLVIDRVAPIGIPLLFPLSGKFFNLGFFPNLQRGAMADLFSIHNAWTLVLENLVFLMPVLILCRKEFLPYLKGKDKECWKI